MNSIIAFIICCKESSYIINCIENINKIYPSSSIYIVDSCSEDKSYFEVLKKYNNVIIEDICNKNYEYGSYIYCFNKYKNNHDIFVFMQDSILINNKIIDMLNINKDTIYVFDKNLTGWNTGIPHKELFYNINPNFPKTDPSKFLMTIWNSFIVLKETFEKIINSEIFKLAQPPINKMTSCAWERAWSIIFYENGINIEHIDTNNITKLFGNRQ